MLMLLSNVLSLVFIVKCYSKSFLLRIIIIIVILRGGRKRRSMEKDEKRKCNINNTDFQ